MGTVGSSGARHTMEAAFRSMEKGKHHWCYCCSSIRVRDRLTRAEEDCAFPMKSSEIAHVRHFEYVLKQISHRLLGKGSVERRMNFVRTFISPLALIGLIVLVAQPIGSCPNSCAYT